LNDESWVAGKSEKAWLVTHDSSFLFSPVLLLALLENLAKISYHVARSIPSE
jgi:hypothetical protein